MGGLVGAIHQHLLVGELDAPGLLLIMLVLLLLGALVLAGRSIFLGWTLEPCPFLHLWKILQIVPKNGQNQLCKFQ